MTNLANGTVDMIMSTTGWDINPRALGTVPADFKVGYLKNMHWVTDAHYAVIPPGRLGRSDRRRSRAHEVDAQAGPAGQGI